MVKDYRTPLDIVKNTVGFQTISFQTVGLRPRRHSQAVTRPSREIPPLQFPFPKARPQDVDPLERRLHEVWLAAPNPQQALDEFSRILQEIFHADCCVITGRCATLYGTAQHPHLTTDAEFRQQCSALARQLVGHPLFQFPSGQGTLIIADVHSLIPALNLPGNFPFKSVLAIQSQQFTQVNGVILLMRSQAQEWKEQSLQLLETLSPQVAIALTQYQLEQQVQHQLHYQTINDQLTAAIRTGCELPQIFDLATQGITAALPASRSLVLLLQSAASELAPSRVNIVSESPQVCYLSEDCPFVENKITVYETSDATSDATLVPEQGTWLNRVMSISTCDLCQVLLSKSLEPLILPDPDSIASAPMASPFLENMPSLMLMPIEHQGMVMGGLLVQDQELREWTAEERSFVKLVAAQLSTAIIQARSFEQIQAVVNERTALLQRSLEVQSKLYHTTRQQVEQLHKLNEEREEFLSTVSHELLTPLTSMGLAIRMLRQASLSPDRQNRYLDILEQQCQQETQIINDMLALRKLESHPPTQQYHKIDLRYLLRDVAKHDDERWQSKGLDLRLELPTKPMTIFSDPDSLNRILVELLNNARKYADINSQVHFKAVHEVEYPRNEMILTIRSVGLGIQPDEIEQVFNKFTRGKAATRLAIQGTGLGLTLVKRMVEQIHGTIAVTSQPIPGSDSWETCFTLTLPPCPEGVIRAI